MDINTGRVTAVAPMNLARRMHGAVASSQNLLVFGGLQQSRPDNFDSCEIYDPVENKYASP